MNKIRQVKWVVCLTMQIATLLFLLRLCQCSRVNATSTKVKLCDMTTNEGADGVLNRFYLVIREPFNTLHNMQCVNSCQRTQNHK